MTTSEVRLRPWYEREHRLVLASQPQGARAFTWRGPALIGVLNVTPDSFSDGGSFPTTREAAAAGVAMVESGALAVDVGGESTRPGAPPVSQEEETRRVVPVVEALVQEGVTVSIDTRKAAVAEEALRAGAVMVNDVSGLRDPEMIEVCARMGAAVVIMHMRGEPKTMQRAPKYDDVVAEVERYLLAKALEAREAGILGVAIDPGIGFGKGVQHNLSLLAATKQLAARGWPVMVGASRKSFIGRLTGEESPAKRGPGTLAAHLHAARGGAALLRVHDVADHAQALAVAAAIDRESDRAAAVRSEAQPVGRTGGARAAR